MQMPPPNHGAAYINEKIYHSKIINAHIEKYLIPINFTQNLTQIGKLSFNKVIKLISLSYSLIKNLISAKPDYVYFTANCTGLAFFRDCFLIFLIKLFRKKLILHFHGKGIEEKSAFLLYRISYHLAFRHTYLLFVSECLMKTECSQLKLKNGHFHCVQNGIELITSPIINRKETGTINLLFLSTLMPSKGVYVLLDSLAQLKASIKNFHLDMVGGTMDKNERQHILSYLKQKGLEPYVTIHPPAYELEKYTFFQSADIFIHPTLNEAFGLVILEAMQFALPVITTIEGGIPDIVVDNFTGLLIEKNNPDALTEKIARLISNPMERKQLGQAGYQRFKERFTLHHFEKNMASTLEKIMAK